MQDGPAILALDQSSTRTGFVIGAAAGPVRIGSYANPRCGERFGMALNFYRAWLARTIEDNGIRAVAFEKPVIAGRKTGLNVARLLYGIAGVIEMEAEARNLPLFEVDTNEMKRLIYGKAGRKPEPAAAIRHCRRWGFKPGNGDEADACGVFLFTVKHQCPGALAVWMARRAER